MHFSFITISQHLGFKVKMKNDSNKQIATTTESSPPWSDRNFPKVCSKTLPDNSTLRQFLSAIRSYMLHNPNSAEGNCLTENENAHTMYEKRHKINKFAKDQNIIVRNSPALDCHVFVPSQNR